MVIVIVLVVICGLVGFVCVEYVDEKRGFCNAC